MLGINMEFRKGILFVRLKGVLDRYTLQNFKVEVSDLIKKNGIKYLVMNLNHLDYIDDVGMKQLLKDYRQVASLDGKVVICGIEEKNYPKNLLKNTYVSNNELSAFSILNI
ncbi:MAG: STAS domain-containing protein [Bacilli bacterium]